MTEEKKKRGLVGRVGKGVLKASGDAAVGSAKGKMSSKAGSLAREGVSQVAAATGADELVGEIRGQVQERVDDVRRTVEGKVEDQSRKLEQKATERLAKEALKRALK